MSIRQSNKDHLRELAPQLAPVAAITQSELADEDPLFFVTRHAMKPCSVDLHVFSDGQAHSRSNGPNWRGGFTGRPELILELAPAIKDRLIAASEATCTKYIKDLRAWWRLLDSFELPHPNTGQTLGRVLSVRELTELHGQLAADSGVGRNTFSTFRAIADDTRRALGLRPLHWQAPEAPDPKRHLPSDEKIKRIWTALKMRWFNALDRWSHAGALLSGESTPTDDSEELLLENYRHFANVQSAISLSTGRLHPSVEELRRAYPRRRLPNGIAPMTMYLGFYPDAWDVRAAFHLCLAGTGWNAQTLLDLTVDVSDNAPSRTPFLQPHPSDANRYVLRGFKERGKSDHILYGDWKTNRSPGTVLHTLVERTWPLRMQVMRELHVAEVKLAEAQAARESPKRIEKMRGEVTRLRSASRSVWLYVDSSSVGNLTRKNYYLVGSGPYLRAVIDQLNAALNKECQCPYIVAGDFRDAFAAYVWRSTGGSILHVMKALAHRRPKTTGTYLGNTAVNDESSAVFLTFGNGMWHQVQTEPQLDATLLAKVTRDGQVTPLERARLVDYRALKRSRVGVSCKDPCHPPASIDPEFVADGVAQCVVHRCTLCLTHAVITEASLPGLAMRLAELRWLKTNIPLDSFIAGEFNQELDNTELALQALQPSAFEAEVARWTARIEQGEHRVLEFVGLRRRGTSEVSR